MITGDHAVTANAIGQTLGLGPGAISGTELQALSDEEVSARLPELHVFGRVTPEDKLRLARLMQEQGLIVAMTGDAVNDAAALKQADIGVAMGSGSEVTKQAGRMILTDDNFGTLVHAVEIGRRVYDKVVAYVRYQMTQLLSLVMLFIAATAFNINEGVALTPMMMLYLLFFVTSSGVIVIAVDPGDPDVMHRPPRDPKLPITNRGGDHPLGRLRAVLFLAALVPLVFGPDTPSTDEATASMTMTFVVMGLGTVFNALTNRRDPASGLSAPLLKAVAVALVPVALIVLATELPRPPEGPAHDVAHRARVAREHRARPASAARDRAEQVDPPPTRPRPWTRSTRSALVRRRLAAHAHATDVSMSKNKKKQEKKAQHEEEHAEARPPASEEEPAAAAEAGRGRDPAGPPKLKEQGVRRRSCGACTASSSRCRSGSRRPGRRSASSSRGATRRARAGRSRRSPSASARACSGSSRCRRRPSARSRRCTSSATSRTSRRRRGRDLRSQLVQPRRRRAGDGLLHPGADAASSSSRCRRSSRR